MSMRLKAAAVIMAIIFVFTTASLFLGLSFTRSSMTAAMEQQLSLALDIADTVVATKISLLKSNAETIAERLNACAEGELQGVLDSQLGEFADFIALTVLHDDGIVAGCGTPMTPHDILMESQYIHQAQQGAPVLSSTLIDDASHEMVMYVFADMDQDRVLGATIPGMFFSDTLSGYRLWETGNIFMLDGEGTFIAHYRAELVLGQHNFILESRTDPELRTAGGFYQSMLTGTGAGAGRYDYEGQERLCVYKGITGSAAGWYICATAPLSESPQRNVQTALILAALSFLAAGLVVSALVSGQVIKPFIKIETQYRNLETLNDTVKQQAALIRDDNERTRLLLDATPLACRLWSRNYEIIDCNDESVKLFGMRDKDEYISQRFDISPEYQPDGRRSHDLVYEILDRVFEEGGRTVFEWMHQNSQGELIPAEITLVRVPYGLDYAVAGYTRDLREQKRMIGELERRDDLLNIVNDAAGILLRSEPDAFERDLYRCMGLIAEALGADRVSIWKNHREEGLLHYSQVFEWKEGVGADELESFVSISEPRRYGKTLPGWEERLAGGESIYGLARDMEPGPRAHLEAQGVLTVFVTPVFLQDQFWGFVAYDNHQMETAYAEGERMTMRSGGIVIANALFRYEMMLSVQDASDRLEAALSEAQDASQAKSNFLANMSHEMRTPLNAILGLSELTLEAGRMEEEDRINLEKINNAGMTLISTVNDILDISKIEAGKFELISVEYDLPSLLNDTVTQSSMFIGEKFIDFVLNIDENLPARLLGDELRIKQVLNNLLSNAFKYTREGTVELKVRCQREGEEVMFTADVRDTGAGILPENIDKLFEDYSQVDQKSNRRIMGTGLGLPIVKKLIEMMGGSISVESEYGVGSVFTVRLPQHYVSDEVIGPAMAENLMSFHFFEQKRDQNAKLSRVSLPYARVLVVDDVATNLDVAKGLMKPYGMTIDCVASGQEAIDAIRDAEVRYNAVFMDHMMPVMDGIEAAQRIRELGTDYAKSVPIIALTANALSGNEEMFLSKGFQAFISKPIDINHLDTVIRLWVRDREQEKLYYARQMELNIGMDQEEYKKQRRAVSDRRSGIDRRALGKGLEGVDIDEGIERFGGDEDAYFDVLRSFVLNTPPLLEAAKGVTGDNLPDYTIIVHGIKGSGRGICANEFADIAEALEKAARAEDFDFVDAHNASFLSAAWKLISDMDDMLLKIYLDNPKPVKDEPDMATLDKLSEACANYDMDSADTALAELECFEYETNGELVPWLRENVEDVNFALIIEKLNEYHRRRKAN
ncbi:MAG: ATP-binding protein [Clostridiales bacterium]|nr:ATP-binding protein [Clostridiales bacterium]